MKKNKNGLTGSNLENDADVVVSISLQGHSLHLCAASRHDAPLDTFVNLTDAEKKLIKEIP